MTKRCRNILLYIICIIFGTILLINILNVLNLQEGIDRVDIPSCPPLPPNREDNKVSCDASQGALKHWGLNSCDISSSGSNTGSKQQQHDWMDKLKKFKDKDKKDLAPSKDPSDASNHLCLLG